jgi:hypothetical protein
MGSSRFTNLTSPIRTSSLRRLRTALSSTSVRSTSSSRSSSHSPLSRASSPSPSASSGASHAQQWGHFSSPTSSVLSSSSSLSIARIRQFIQMRRQPSIVDLEMEEERRVCMPAELGLLEPRPMVGERGVCVGSIFEVLDGRV